MAAAIHTASRIYAAFMIKGSSGPVLAGPYFRYEGQQDARERTHDDIHHTARPKIENSQADQKCQ